MEPGFQEMKKTKPQVKWLQTQRLRANFKCLEHIVKNRVYGGSPGGAALAYCTSVSVGTDAMGEWKKWCWTQGGNVFSLDRMLSS